MELILISESKLKIILSDGDMKQYSLDVDKTNYDNDNAREIFHNILDEAKRKVGFDSDKHRVFIQLYPSKSGGGEMYVSKISPLREDFPEKKLCSVLKAKSRQVVFSFDNVENLISVCRKLSEYSDIKESSALFDGDKYFLIISESEENVYISPNENSFVSEYGSRVNLKNTLAYLGEYGKYICKENAIEIMQSL